MAKDGTLFFSCSCGSRESEIPSSSFPKSLTVWLWFSDSFLPYEEIISKLDRAARSFRGIVIKTDMTIPCTSVFLQLDCA